MPKEGNGHDSDAGQNHSGEPRAEHKKGDSSNVWSDVRWGSVVYGWLAALGAGLILSGVMSGFLAASFGDGGAQIGGEGLERVGLLLTVFLAFLVGGYVAGRMAGHSGVKHGLLVPLLALGFTLILMLFGLVVGVSFLDNLSGVTLPEVPKGARRGLESIFSLSGILVLFCVPFVGGAFGGALGARADSRCAQ